jgi:S1-C subfamily serine protease
VISAVNAKEPGDELTFTISRDGEQRDVTVKLGDRPAQAQDSSNSQP